jgi:hypothetical protein
LGFATMRRLRLAALPRRAFAGLPPALERCRIAFPEAQEAIVSVQTNIREGAWEGSVQPPRLAHSMSVLGQSLQIVARRKAALCL